MLVNLQPLAVLIGKLAKIEEFAKKSADKTMENKKKEIADMNREQLLEGFDSEGDVLGEYAPLSKILRREKGLQIKHIDLSDTGDFQKSIKLKKKRVGEWAMDATDWKWEQELKPSWPDALGLGEIAVAETEMLIAEQMVTDIYNNLKT